MVNNGCHFIGTGIGASRFGVHQAGTQIDFIRFDFGEFHGHTHRRQQCPSRTFAFHKRDNQGRVFERALTQGRRLEATSLPGAAIPTVNIGATSDNGYFFHERPPVLMSIAIFHACIILRLYPFQPLPWLLDRGKTDRADGDSPKVILKDPGFETGSRRPGCPRTQGSDANIRFGCRL